MSAREKRIAFHVHSNDYFATLASILSFFEESLDKEVDALGKSIKDLRHFNVALKRINKDLIHLQENYLIIQKKAQKGGVKG